MNSIQENQPKIKVVGIRERETNKLDFLPINDNEFKRGEICVIETSMGIDTGVVITGTLEVEQRHLNQNGCKFIRKADHDDLKNLKKNKSREKTAYKSCLAKIAVRKLPMKLVGVKYLLDASKAIFFFTADGRIDFRGLVRDLAREFKCRIEMKQIGVRDEAKMLGGLGICGRELCCCAFLRDFEPVSIRMAKEQGLTLIPSKISGICGRLMCCLVYEYEDYLEIRKQLPRLGRKINTLKGPAKLLNINVLRESVTVEYENGEKADLSIIEVTKLPLTAKSACKNCKSNPNSDQKRQDERRTDRDS